MKEIDAAIEALELAHEQLLPHRSKALRWYTQVDAAIDKTRSALAGLRALKEREPVAHMNQNGVIHEAGYEWGPNNHLTPLYAAPVEQK